MGDNQEGCSFDETSDPSEENLGTLTPSVGTTREIAYDFLPEKKVCGTQSERILKIFFPQKKITYKNKVFFNKFIVLFMVCLFLTNSVWFTM